MRREIRRRRRRRLDREIDRHRAALHVGLPGRLVVVGMQEAWTTTTTTTITMMEQNMMMMTSTQMKREGEILCLGDR